MNGEAIGFWVFSVVAVGGAIAMVTFRNVVHGALMLVMNFFAIAGLFLLLGTSFLATIQIIIYAGAIMVLFLFVIMLLGGSRDDLLVARERWVRFGAWLVGLLLVGAVAIVFVGPYTGPASVCPPSTATAEGQPAASVRAGDIGCRGLVQELADNDGSVRFAAVRLFERYTFAFEFVSLLLVVAIVGAMVLARRREPDTAGGMPARDLGRSGPDALGEPEPVGADAGRPRDEGTG